MAVFRRLREKTYSSPPTPPAPSLFKDAPPNPVSTSSLSMPSMSSVLNEEEKLLLEAMQSDSPVAKDKTQKQQQNFKKKTKEAKKQAKAQAKKKAKAQARKKAKALAKTKKKAMAKEEEEEVNEEESEEESGEESEEEDVEEPDEEIAVELDKIMKKKRRNVCVSDAYHSAEKAAYDAGMSPDTSKKIARAAYKKAASQFDRL
jgi:hypothetical protein